MSSGPIHRRRWFQFRLRTLLLLPVAFSFSWWWVNWPQRTIDRLDELVAANRLDEAAGLIEFEPDYRYPPTKVAHSLRSGLGQRSVYPAQRSVIDLFLGRQRFEIDQGGLAAFVNTGEKSEHMMIESIAVERGRIKYQWGLSMADYEQRRIQSGR